MVRVSTPHQGEPALRHPPSALHVQWESAGCGIARTTVPSALLYTAEAISASPFATVVLPAALCATRSLASGDGLSLATAGVAASFTIQTRDLCARPPRGLACPCEPNRFAWRPNCRAFTRELQLNWLSGTPRH